MMLQSLMSTQTSGWVCFDVTVLLLLFNCGKWSVVLRVWVSQTEYSRFTLFKVPRISFFSKDELTYVAYFIGIQNSSDSASLRTLYLNSSVYPVPVNRFC